MRGWAGLRRTVAALTLAAALTGPARAAEWVASHQFPEGDVRGTMVERVAADMAAAGVPVRVIAGAALMRPHDQFPALVNGSLDMALIPVDYMTGELPELAVLSLPGIVGSLDRAARVAAAPVMRELRSRIEAKGVVVVADAWVAGAFGANGRCLALPGDAKGLRVRWSGLGFRDLWRSVGAETVDDISSDAVHRLLSSRLIDAVDTSVASMMSFRLYERLSCVTLPGEVALWLLYEPLLVSRQSFDALTDAQKAVLMESGHKAAAEFAQRIRAVDAALAGALRTAGARVTAMTAKDAEPWIAQARRSSWRTFADRVPGGAALIERLRAVE